MPRVLMTDWPPYTKGDESRRDRENVIESRRLRYLYKFNILWV